MANTKDILLTEVLEKKFNMEEEIAKLIVDFQNETELAIGSIEIKSIQTGKGQSLFCGVQATINL